MLKEESVKNDVIPYALHFPSTFDFYFCLQVKPFRRTPWTSPNFNFLKRKRKKKETKQNYIITKSECDLLLFAAALLAALVPRNPITWLPLL